MPILTGIFLLLFGYGVYNILGGIALLISAATGLLVLPFGIINDVNEWAAGTSLKDRIRRSKRRLDRAEREHRAHLRWRREMERLHDLEP